MPAVDRKREQMFKEHRLWLSNLLRSAQLRNWYGTITIDIKRGEMIALVGPTGGGKSTIVNLLCRFYEPQKGNIKIGGVDYTRLSQENIQSHIGIVPQSPHLFSMSIKENIAYLQTIK